MEIRVEGLCKSYHGKLVLDNLNAVFPHGRYLYHCTFRKGKTTLLRLLLGLERPDSGTVRGANLRWSAVFQEDRLLEDLTASANLRFALEVSRESRAMLEQLGLPAEDLRPVRAWSGGMKRRLALARAMLAPSEALALDEPFTGLDAESRARCVKLIRAAGKEKPVLLATHDLTGLEDTAELRL